MYRGPVDRTALSCSSPNLEIVFRRRYNKLSGAEQAASPRIMQRLWSCQRNFAKVFTIFGINLLRHYANQVFVGAFNEKKA